MISKSYRKIITKEEYYKLLNLQIFHKMIMNMLNSIEEQALLITQEIDENDIESKLLYGGYTADMLNSGSKEALDDMLRNLNIEVEKDKVVENKKEIGKVIQKKKKFKSGDGWKNKELDKPVIVVDRPEFHDYLLDFVVDNQPLTGRRSIEGLDLKNVIWQTEKKVDEKDGLFVSEHWNQEIDDVNYDLGDG